MLLVTNFTFSILLFNFLIRHISTLPANDFLPNFSISSHPSAVLRSNSLSPSATANHLLDPSKGWSLVQQLCQQQPQSRVCEQTILWPSEDQPKSNASDFKNKKNISTRSHSPHSQSKFSPSIKKHNQTIDFSEFLRKHIQRATSSLPGGARLQAMLETMIKNTNWKMVSFRILRQLSMLLIDQILTKMLQFDWRIDGQYQVLKKKIQLPEQNQTMHWWPHLNDVIKRKRKPSTTIT